MRTAIIIGFFVGLVAGDTVLHPRGCIYIVGKCYKDCPEGTHAYALGCGFMTPEPTCRNPNPVEEPYMICDYSACYCDPPTIRDEKTDTCVLKELCSPQEPEKEVSVPATTLLPPKDQDNAEAEATANGEKPKDREEAEAEKPKDRVEAEAEKPKDREEAEAEKPKDQEKAEAEASSHVEKPKDLEKTDEGVKV